MTKLLSNSSFAIGVSLTGQRRVHLVAVFVVCCIPLVNGHAEDKPQTAPVLVKVTGDGAPVSAATVFMATADNSYSESIATDDSGYAAFSSVPLGKVTLQVTAQGWKTHGTVRVVKAPSSTFPVDLQAKPKPKSDANTSG